MLEKRDEIIQRLQYFQGEDKQMELFGAKKHQYILYPTVEAHTIAAFEVLHGIRLPEDFKEFYTKIGGGGAGPYYGLYDTLNNLTFVPSPVLAIKCLDIDIDFDRIDYDDIEELVSSNHAFKELVNELGEEVALVKLLEIAEYGCGEYIYLILSGRDYRKVAVGIIYTEAEIDNRTVVYPAFNVIYNDFDAYYMDWIHRILPHELDMSMKNKK